MCNKINITKINLKQISNYKNNLSENIHERCCVCNKLYEISLKTKKLNKKAKNKDKICSFCQRNNFSEKVFIFNLKCLPVFIYVKNNQNKIALRELSQYISYHVKSGLGNPSFFYDPETMNWFVDLSKNISKKQIKKTIIEILFCFNLWETIPYLDQKKLLKCIFKSISIDEKFILRLEDFGVKTSFSKKYVENFKIF